MKPAHLNRFVSFAMVGLPCAALAADYNIDTFTGLTGLWATNTIWNPDAGVGVGPLAADNILITGGDLTGTTNIDYATGTATNRSITNITVTDSNNGAGSGAQFNFRAGVAGSHLQFATATPTVSTNIINQNSGGNRLTIENPLFQSSTTFTKGGTGNVRLLMTTTTSSSSFSSNVTSLTSTGGGSLWLTSPTAATAITLPTVSFSANNTGLVLTNGGYTATNKTIALGTGRLSMGASGTLNLEGTSTLSGGTIIMGSNNSNEYYMGGSATVNMNATSLSVQNLNMGDQKSSNGTLVFNQLAGTTSISTNAFLGAPSSNSGASNQILELNLSAGILQFTRASGLVDFEVGRNARGGTNTAALTLNGAVSISGTGTLNLGSFARMVIGTDTSNYADNTTGTLNLNGGTLKTAREIARGTNNAVGGTDSSLVILNGGTLQTTAAIAEIFVNFGSTATNGVLVSSGGAVIDTNGFNSGTAAILQANTLSTGGGLTKNGTGTLTLSAANTLTGDTLVNAGTLALANSSALQNSTFDSSGAGSLSFGSLTAATFGGLKGSNNLALQNTTPAAVTLTVGGNNQNTTFSGNLTGLGGLTKTGNGTLLLSGSNGYTGTTQLREGTLLLSGANNRLASGSAVSFAGSATLDLGGNSQTLANLTNAAGSYSAAVTNGALTIQGGTGNLNFAPAQTTNGQAVTLDMSGLTSFTYQNPTKEFQVGGGGTYGNTLDLSLSAGTNTITAVTLHLALGGNGTWPFNGSTLRLGTTNTLNLGTGSGTAIQLSGYRSSGNHITFLGSPAASSLKIRAADGASRAGAIVVSSASSGTGSGNPITASFDLGVADALVGDIVVADTVQTGTGAAVTGTMTMAGGTLDATSLVLGRVNTAGTPTNTNTLAATFTQNGGTATIGTLTMGNVIAGEFQITGTLPNFQSTYTVGAGAVLEAGTISANPSGMAFRNTSVRNLNLSGGTLRHLAGSDLTVSGADTTAAGRVNLNITAASTLQSDAGRTVTLGEKTYLTGSEDLTKTGAGKLVLNGNSSTFTGTLSVSAGTLGGSTTLGGALALTSAGTLAPGNSIGTIGADTLIWEGLGLMSFELSDVDNTADLLALTGAFTKGSGSGFLFDFNHTGLAGETYTLVTFGSSNFSTGDFSYTNLPSGKTGSFSLNGGALTFAVVPEPGIALLGGAGLLVLLRRRRRP